MYRALALKAIENDLAFDEEAAAARSRGEHPIRLEPQLEGNRVLLDGLDVSRRIRDTDVTAAASRVSVHPHLRAWMVRQQRALGAQGGIVMEGRDIGTAVFPDAEVKIFLDASPEVRGDRRYRQVLVPREERVAASSTPPETPTAEQIEAQQQILRDMKERDQRDRNRTESPLRPAPDAVILDSTSITLDQVLAQCGTDRPLASST